MEHYITEINIARLRHLSNLQIVLNPNKRQHLLLTGKNGSGKTSFLLSLKDYFQKISDVNIKDFAIDYAIPSTLENGYIEEKFTVESNDLQRKEEALKKRLLAYSGLSIGGVDISFNQNDNMDVLCRKGDFITAFFPVERKTRIERANGVEDVKLKEYYGIESNPGTILLKYMVHLKTQQAYARNEGDMVNVEQIQGWFDRFESALRVLLDNDSINLEYDYKGYDFKIHEEGRTAFNFEQLSDGYSSVIHIFSDLLLRMDRNWFLRNRICQYDMEGVVLIDELETHLHIELQRKILPFLTKFFPRIQFIVTTHSPYILNSISNAKVYDLEKHMELENLSGYSSESLVEGYFEVDEYSDELREKIRQYGMLVQKENLSVDERIERARLHSELKDIPRGLAREAKEAFEEIEMRRLHGKI